MHTHAYACIRKHPEERKHGYSKQHDKANTKHERITIMVQIDFGDDEDAFYNNAPMGGTVEVFDWGSGDALPLCVGAIVVGGVSTARLVVTDVLPLMDTSKMDPSIPCTYGCHDEAYEGSRCFGCNVAEIVLITAPHTICFDVSLCSAASDDNNATQLMRYCSMMSKLLSLGIKNDSVPHNELMFASENSFMTTVLGVLLQRQKTINGTVQVCLNRLQEAAVVEHGDSSPGAARFMFLGLASLASKGYLVEFVSAAVSGSDEDDDDNIKLARLTTYVKALAKCLVYDELVCFVHNFSHVEEPIAQF